MYKIGVIGDNESILGFKALGFVVRPCENADQVTSAFDDMVKENYAVIYITEAFYEILKKDILKFEELTTPAIIPIPGMTGNTGSGIANVKKSVERAVGSDIIFGND